VTLGFSSQTGEKPQVAVIPKSWQINCVAHDEDRLITACSATKSRLDLRESTFSVRLSDASFDALTQISLSNSAKNSEHPCQSAGPLGVAKSGPLLHFENLSLSPVRNLSICMQQ
jgi:hypothetical protein